MDRITVQVTSPPDARAIALARLGEALAAAALDHAVTVEWESGMWGLTLGSRVWTGASPTVAEWTDWLLDAWWNHGGASCC